MAAKDIVDKIPGLSVASVIGAVCYSLITSGVFATKDNVASASDVLRAEAAYKFVIKADYKEDIQEMKTILKEIQKDTEQIRIDQARARR